MRGRFFCLLNLLHASGHNLWACASIMEGVYVHLMWINDEEASGKAQQEYFSWNHKKGTVRAANSDLGPALFLLPSRAVKPTLNTSLCKWWCSPFLIGFEKHLYCRLNKCLSVYFFPSIRQKCAQAQPSGRHGGGIIVTELATKPYTILTVVWVHNNLQ